ncbi:hypothetical protein AOQ84DRAFT_371044 [Glonium stellatum]|uniref:Uncharacterized protein n=1 Tax=Glonium stellatum TaxID=574774 RepID=A0A8E2FCX7_9PEZI|nr:hypothetical protein AOQ84DRAFT_371044 [Glonium stellatum]
MTQERLSVSPTNEPKSAVTNIDNTAITGPYEETKSPGDPGVSQSKFLSDSAACEWWIWELIGVVGSAGAIIGLCILFWMHNNQPTPSWQFTYSVGHGRKTANVTFNAIIEMISTIARLCLLIPITRGLSQLKWAWFAEKERNLIDLTYFEAASRQSLLDSFKLLWTLKLSHFAIVGVFAIILAQGLSFFTQNLATYPVLYRPDLTLNKPLPPNMDELYTKWLQSGDVAPPPELQIARIVNATTYQAQSAGDAPYYNVHLGMKANIWAALYGIDISSDWYTPKFLCSTGNCTWKNYSSLGVCTRCSNITSRLTKNCVPKPSSDLPGFTGCDFSLPNGFSLGGEEGSRRNLMAMNTSLQPLVYTNYEMPIAVVQSIRAYNTSTANSTSSVNASECVLVPCVIKYGMAYSALYPDVRKTGYNGPVFMENADSIWDNYTFNEDGITINPQPNTTANDTTKFTMDRRTYLGLKYYVEALFNGFVQGGVSESLSFLSDNRTQNVTASTADAMQAVYLPGTLGCFDVYMNVVWDANMCALINTGVAMTNIIRRYAYSIRTYSIAGETFELQSFVVIRWIWILPVAGLWFLSFITLLGTIWKTRRMGLKVWCGNPLALVFLGLSREELEKVNRDELIEGGPARRAFKVQLRLTNGQAKLFRSR